MKQYLLKAAGAATMFAMIATGSFAQNEKKDTAPEISNRGEDVIIINPKINVDTKLTIEIKGDDVKINGKPLSEFKNTDVTIIKRKNIDADVLNGDMVELRAPHVSRFRGGNSYSYGGSADNMLRINGYSSNTNKAFLGVGTEKSKDGVTITSVTNESGAFKAGLKKGDVITMINQTKISSPEELTTTIGKFNPDEKVSISYKRDQKLLKATAVLTKRKNESFNYTPDAFTYKNFNFDNNMSYSFNGKRRLGLKAQETEDGKGLKVLDVDDESAAEKAGIKEGDIITSFDGTEINNIDKLRELSAPAIEKGNFKVKIIRDGTPQELEVKIPKKLKTTSL